MAIFVIRDPACVFIHIPKTGGASIRKSFFKGNHGESCFYELPPEAEALFRFAFVRNPFDRLVSAFHMFTSGLEDASSRLYDRTNQDSPYRRAMSFAEFVAIVLDESVRFDEQRASLEEQIRHHTIPQRHSLHGLQHAEFVGRYEHFDRHFWQVAGRLGCQCSAQRNGEVFRQTRATLPSFDA